MRQAEKQNPTPEIYKCSALKAFASGYQATAADSADKNTAVGELVAFVEYIGGGRMAVLFRPRSPWASLIEKKHSGYVMKRE